jgi:hypothetical protein
MHRWPVKDVDNHLTECVFIGAPEFVFYVDKLDLATFVICIEGDGLLLKPLDQWCFEVSLLLVYRRAFLDVDLATSSSSFNVFISS